jgi:hypothetical protein
MTGWAVMHGTIACYKELFVCHLDIRTPVAGYQTAPHSGDSSPESAPPHHSYCLGCDLRSYVHEPPLGKAEDAEEARIRRGDEANLLQQQDHFLFCPEAARL